jgi:hypothetical protein
MKFSIALTLLILVLGIASNWQTHQQLVFVREYHAELVAKAAQSGIPTEPMRRRDDSPNTKRMRENAQGNGKALAADFITAVIETEAFKRKNVIADEALKRKNLDLLASVMSLDSDQIRILISELLLASKELKVGQREELREILAGIANDHPQAALELFAKSAAIINEYSFGKQILNTSLTKWAIEAPMATVEWVRKNGEKFPELIDRNTKCKILSSATENHPELTLPVIKGLGLEQDLNALSIVEKLPKNAAERMAALVAIPAKLASLPEGESKTNASNLMLNGIMRSAVEEGFDAGTKWLIQAGFTPEQLSHMPDENFFYQIKLDESGKWVEWFSKTLTSGKTDICIRKMIEKWTEKDHRAAGEWLASTPEGPAKNSSIRAFAETIASRDPQTAEQWAMTLPPGNDRRNTLKRIHHKWPNNQEVAKEAFAKMHHLK